MISKRLFRTPAIDWSYKFNARSQQAAHPALEEYYQHALPDPATPMGEIEFVAIDFETTGLDSDKDDIITIGLVPFTLKRIHINRARHWVVRPRQKLDEHSVVIHGITVSWR